MVVESPIASSSSAAFRHSCIRAPKLRRAIFVPSFTTRPLPISSGWPRSGAEAVVDSPLLDAVDRLVYVSCDAASFARDAARLTGRGFELAETGIADMFPQTAHVESLSLFTRV